MIVLIIGYPDSGKSRLAEDLVMEMSPSGKRIYLATMIPYGEDGRRRIEKHRKLREGKGFITIEAPFDVADAIDSTEDLHDTAVLLECLSNLVANELFGRHSEPEAVTDKIRKEILSLAGRVGDLVIVSNHFDITEDFDEDTRSYAVTMDAVNDSISALADRVINIE